MEWLAWVVIAAFCVSMIALGRFLRRRDEDGSFDAGPSSAARPGQRWFFSREWRTDGRRQRPPSRGG